MCIRDSGLTVSTGALTISKTSDLFTRDVTSLSLKCISSDSAYFDVITVLKLYDTADLEIGGRNLALNSRKGWYSASSHVMNGKMCIRDRGYGDRHPGFRRG